MLPGLWAHEQVPLACQGLAAPNSLGLKEIDENLADEAQKAGEDGC